MKDYSPKSGNNQEEQEESILNGLENINRLEELAKHGARIILSLALKNKFDEYIEKRQNPYRMKKEERSSAEMGNTGNERFKHSYRSRIRRW